MRTPHPVRRVKGSPRALPLLALAALALWLGQAAPALAQSQSTKPKVDESKTMVVHQAGAFTVYYANRRDGADGILISLFDAGGRKAQVGYALNPRSCVMQGNLFVHGTELAGLTKLTGIDVSARVDEGPVVSLTGELKRRQADGLFSLESPSRGELDRLLTGIGQKAQALRVKLALPTGDVIYRFDLGTSQEAFDKARQACEASVAKAKAAQDAKQDADFFK